MLMLRWIEDGEEQKNSTAAVSVLAFAAGLSLADAAAVSGAAAGSLHGQTGTGSRRHRAVERARQRRFYECCGAVQAAGGFARR